MLTQILSLSPWPTAFACFILHCMIGLIAAALAYRQGRPLRPWLALGLLGGTVALVFVTFTQPKS